jgi:Arc/MetJ family transcription regulator
MATNLAIDDSLLEQARVVGGLRTKKAVVTQALVEYIQKRQQLKVLDLFGTVQYDEGYDHKAQRKVKHASAG